MQRPKILVAGDSSVLIEFGNEIRPETNRRIAATVQLIREQQIEGIVDMIPTYCALLINYDPRVILYDPLVKRLQSLLKIEVSAGEEKKRIYEIPVCYGENTARTWTSSRNMPGSRRRK